MTFIKGLIETVYLVRWERSLAELGKLPNYYGKATEKRKGGVAAYNSAE